MAAEPARHGHPVHPVCHGLLLRHREPRCPLINTKRLGAEAAAELKERMASRSPNTMMMLGFLAAETEPQTVLADPASVNYAVYETLSNNAAPDRQG